MHIGAHSADNQGYPICDMSRGTEEGGLMDFMDDCVEVEDNYISHTQSSLGTSATGMNTAPSVPMTPSTVTASTSKSTPLVDDLPPCKSESRG